MTHIATTAKFKDNVHEALTDARLQGALGHARNFITRRAASAERLPEFEALRDSARAIKDHTLAHLDLYLEDYERKVERAAGKSTMRRTPTKRARSSSTCASRWARKPSPRANR